MHWGFLHSCRLSHPFPLQLGQDRAMSSWVTSARVFVRRFRKELCLLALALVMLPSSAFAGTANVRFSLPSDPDVDFFRIYIGVRSRSYDNRFDIRQPALG